MEQTDNVYIKKLLENYTEDSMSNGMPQIMDVNNGLVKIKKYSKTNTIDDLIETDKFQAESSGDWGLEIGAVKSNLFKNRDEFDECIIRSEGRTPILKGESNFNKISIRDALELLNVHITYKTQNENENEDELFNKEMIDLLSDSNDQSTNKNDSDDELSTNGKYKICMIKDYRILSDDGNYILSTASRGSLYLFLNQFSS